MCARSKFLISDFKNKITRLETELEICNVEMNRLEEELKVERRTKRLTSAIPFVWMGLTLFLAVCVPMLFAFYKMH